MKVWIVPDKSVFNEVSLAIDYQIEYGLAADRNVAKNQLSLIEVGNANRYKLMGSFKGILVFALVD